MIAFKPVGAFGHLSVNKKAEIIEIVLILLLNDGENLFFLSL